MIFALLGSILAQPFIILIMTLLFLTDRVQKLVVDGHYIGAPKGSVLGPLLFISYAHDTWFRLENMLVAYADVATRLLVVPSPNMRSVISNSLNRNLAKLSSPCRLWSKKNKKILYVDLSGQILMKTLIKIFVFLFFFVYFLFCNYSPQAQRNTMKL